jgi:hypothetical protein
MTTLEPTKKTVTMGLTTTTFTEPAPERGESASYTIVAVGVDSVSAWSETVKVTSPKRKPMED